MYEFHTTQQGTNIYPGQTFNLGYSLMQILPLQTEMHTLLQFGVVGYGQWQTSNNSGPGVDVASLISVPLQNNTNFGVNPGYFSP